MNGLASDLVPQALRTGCTTAILRARKRRVSTTFIGKDKATQEAAPAPRMALKSGDLSAKKDYAEDKSSFCIGGDLRLW